MNYMIVIQTYNNTLDGFAISPVTSIGRAVHTALGVPHQILRLREASGQTCKANRCQSLRLLQVTNKMPSTESLQHSPSSQAFAATLAAICAEIFLIFLKGGQTSPLSKSSCVTWDAKASAVPSKQSYRESDQLQRNHNLNINIYILLRSPFLLKRQDKLTRQYNQNF